MEFNGTPQLKRLKRAFVAYHSYLHDVQKRGQISKEVPNLNDEIKLIEEWTEATQININRADNSTN